MSQTLQAMEVLRDILTKVGDEFEGRAEGLEGWQLVAGTVAVTLTSLTLSDLFSKRQDVYLEVRDWLFRNVRKIPAVKRYISKQLDQSRRDIEKEMFEDAAIKDPPLNFLPPDGWSQEKVLEEAANILTQGQYNWQEGRISGGAFTGRNQTLNNLMEAMYGHYAFSNPLHCDIFPGVRKMEVEVIQMTLDMFNGDEKACGCLTSGGSESIMLAVKAMRDLGRDRKGIKTGEVVACYTVHAAFDKACAMLGMKLRKVGMDPVSCKADLKAMRRAINSNTVMLVGSAPTFPHGIIDDIEAIGALGLRYDVPVHVDCCMGGFLIPFMARAGYPVPPFDFTVPGITSISADTHKYGNAPKGSSVMMYRSVEYRHHQYFVTPNWPGGIYATASIPGSRPGGLIAVCWGSLMYHGLEGYINNTRAIINTSRKIKELLRELPEIQLFGDPLTSIVAFTSNSVDILKVGDVLNKRGWHLTFTQYPAGLHICLTNLHATQENFAESLVRDVKWALEEVRDNPMKTTGLGKVYGTAAGIPDKSLVGEAAKVFLHCYYSTEATKDDTQEEDQGTTKVHTTSQDNKTTLNTIAEDPAEEVQKKNIHATKNGKMTTTHTDEKDQVAEVQKTNIETTQDDKNKLQHANENYSVKEVQKSTVNANQDDKTATLHANGIVNGTIQAI